MGTKQWAYEREGVTKCGVMTITSQDESSDDSNCVTTYNGSKRCDSAALVTEMPVPNLNACLADDAICYVSINTSKTLPEDRERPIFTKCSDVIDNATVSCSILDYGHNTPDNPNKSTGLDYSVKDKFMCVANVNDQQYWDTLVEEQKLKNLSS
jgi:hypothetical protein